MTKMKNISIALICLLIFAVNLSAQEAGAPPEAVQQGAGQEEPAVGDSSLNIPENIRQGLSSDSITPEQIKSFFSKPKEDNYIILNFDNADLKDVINTVGSITNENFILSPGLDARVTIHSAKKIPVSEVLNVFESVLEANGMSLVKSGEFYKIVSGSSVKQKPLDVQKGNKAEAMKDVDRAITQIVPVEYVPVTEVSAVLTPMLSQVGSIIPNPRNNLLIINDYSSSIIRLLKVLKEIDVNAFKNTRMSFFKPRYSDVLSLSNELTEVLNALNLTREGIALVPIERINSLVVFSASPTLLKTVEGWIRKLDEEVMTGQNIFVYPVQNVKAESIAEILKTLYEAGDGTKPRVTAQKTAATAKKTTAARRRTTRRRTTTNKTTSNSRVEIITFEPTNSLVILAPSGIYREIVKTIKKMDVYPREVLIEAIIAEVDISDSDEYGIRWSVLHKITESNVDYSAAVQGNISPSDGLPLSAVPALVEGPSGGFSYLLFRPDKLSAMVRAIAGKSKTKILQSPRLLVRDQEEASIEVGSEIPTASSTTSTTTTDTLTQNIEYKTVGIKLKIKPIINQEKTVVLDVEQEVSDVNELGRTVGGLSYPEFTSTKAKTSIIVPDKQGIVIGGIMKETTGKGYEGIPLLSSLPLLGPIFRYNTESLVKTELIIIIIPHVLTDRTEGDAITGEFMGKLSEIKKFLGEKKKILNISQIDNEKSPSQVNEP